MTGLVPAIHDDLFGVRLWHVRFDKTMVSPADSQGSLPKTAASTYLDDISTEL